MYNLETDIFIYAFSGSPNKFITIMRHISYFLEQEMVIVSTSNPTLVPNIEFDGSYTKFSMRAPIHALAVDKPTISAV